jgi:uncharacterized membrane protein
MTDSSTNHTATGATATSATKSRLALIRRLAIMLVAVGGMIYLSALMGTHQAASGYQTPAWALWIHLGTVIPALPLGAWVLSRRKGTPAHKMAGRIWMALMFITAIDSFWVRSVTGHIGPIHILSALTIVIVPLSIAQARRGNFAAHKRMAVGLYIGLIVAGAFTLLPGRLIGNLVFG